MQSARKHLLTAWTDVTKVDRHNTKLKQHKTGTRDISQSVRSWNDEFLALFPHRYDFIWAEHSNLNGSVEWQTERRYPLSDRHIQQGSYLHGVRFGSKTQYALLDIDIGSCYHPRNDPFAIAKIISSLEPLGLVSYLACTSSYSDGLHLYLPFEEPQSSWQLAIVLSTLLENAGFAPHPGQLEIFPNAKPYRSDGTYSLFNAHRLPLQIGSYLLNRDFQPIWSDQSLFVQHWNLTRSRNVLDSDSIKRVLKQFRRKSFRMSGKADQYLNDLNAEIELGWTGYGQTNRLLGRITMRSYVFHHVMTGGKPLTGSLLVDEIVRVARSLPGYQEWCQHQHEIEHRAKEWAQCVEASHYFHYGDAHGKYKAQLKESEQSISETPNWNQQQSESARSKIQTAIADLLEKDSLPSTATKRFEKLLQYRIGGGSLYRHKDLWHPQFLSLESEKLNSASLENSTENPADSTPSLLPGNGGNCSSDEACRINTSNAPILPSSINVETWQEILQAALKLASSDEITAHQFERMYSYFTSGDSILMEATAYLQTSQHQGLPTQERALIDSSIDCPRCRSREVISKTKT